GDRDAAGRRPLQAGDRPQDRALARAARPEQRGHPPVGGGERDVVHGRERPELLRQVLDLDPGGPGLLRGGPRTCAGSGGGHVRTSFRSLDLKNSMPINSTMENSASVRATANPRWSWPWSNVRRMYSVAVSVLPWIAPLTMITAP